MSTLKEILTQLGTWCRVNNISVQSVYDTCHGMTLQEMVYYLFGVVEQTAKEVVDYEGQFEELYTYVHDYFDNLDVQDEINKKLDEMLESGIFDTIIKSYFNRKFIFLGDSYILGYSNDGKIYTSYATIINNNLSLNATILGTSGAGFANAGTGPGEGKNFLQTLQTFQGNTSEKNAITDIYVMGGYNDRTHEATEIWKSMSDFSIYSKENFPNARIHVAFIGRSLIPMEYTALEQAALAYSRCGLYNMEYMKSSEYILHSTNYFTSDKIHPNDEGHSILAAYLSNNILGGEIDVIHQRMELVIPPINNVQLGKMYASQNNNIISLSMPDFSNISLEAYDNNYWGTNWIQISDKIAITPLLGYWESYWSGSILWNDNDSEKWYTAPASIKIVDGIFYIQIQALKEDRSGLYNGKIKQCIIPPFTMHSPTLLS